MTQKLLCQQLTLLEQIHRGANAFILDNKNDLALIADHKPLHFMI